MIKRRIQVYFMLLALAMGAAFSAVVYLTVYVVEDGVFVRQLRLEHKAFVDSDKRDDWQPLSRFIRVYRTENSLPEAFRSQTYSEGRVYEHYSQGEAYFLLIDQLDSGDRLFFLYDVSQMLSVRGVRVEVAILLVTLVFAFLLFAWYVGKSLANRSLQPLTALAQILESGSDDLPQGFSHKFKGDEIGELAEALELALNKLQEASEREFIFNRDVSHELRSPIQVAKNAAELIDKKLPNAPAVARLQRAVDEMESISDAFLWLSTQCAQALDVSDSTLDAVVAKVIKGQEHRVEGKAVTVEMEILAPVRVAAPDNIVRVVISNLLRNAIAHTQEGEIRIKIEPQQLSICDSGDGMDAEMQVPTGAHIRGRNSDGFGLGLSIVERLCARVGWSLSLRARAGGGTCAVIGIRTSV